MTMSPAVFTIASANYIASAATLMQSVRQFHPNTARFIILADELRSFDGIDLAAEIIVCDDLEIPLIDNMKLWYTILEFNTAIKPFAFSHFFSRRNFIAAVYLDPDIEIYGNLGDVFISVDDYSLVLTPHITQPLQDSKSPSDLSILKAGVYNLGFAVLKNDEDGRRLVRWWCDRLLAHCRIDIAGNFFTDQRWMDLAPAFVERTLIMRHPGYNVAYWNVAHHRVEKNDSGIWLSDGKPLIFFHFSGMDIGSEAHLSRHQDRHNLSELNEVAQLCAEYRKRVVANGWSSFRHNAYAYSHLHDGQPILDFMRRGVLRAVDDGTLPMSKPLRLGSEYFDAAAEVTFANGRKLTRFAHMLWRDRRDLQEAFDLRTEAGLANFIAWLTEGAAEREGLPALRIEGARTLRRSETPIELSPQSNSPPWPPLSTNAWPGPAKDAALWLTGEVDFDIHGVDMRLPRQAALLWEQRVDLQRCFPLDEFEEVEAYHAWTLSVGMHERSIAADLFTPEYVAWFDAPASISRRYPDIPISRGMVLTRHSGHARERLSNWPSFPFEPPGRLEQAFWCAFLAPRIFGWPAGMTASLRRFFEMPGGRTFAGLRLTRGMLALHAMRADVRNAFDLDDDQGLWGYLRWLLCQGMREHGVEIADLCPDITSFLALAWPRHPELTWMAAFAHAQRADLQVAFDLETDIGLAGMSGWLEADLRPWLDSMGLGQLQLCPDRSEEVSPHRCSLVLSGDWTATSGIGEDLRAAAASLDACSFLDYVIIDLSSGEALKADRSTLPSGTPIHAQWNVVFHNADTAFEDWRRLRQLGIESERVAAHWMWELEHLPSRWTHAFSFYDEVWAASDFVKAAVETAAQRPVRKIHQAVILPEASPLERARAGLQEEATLFLFVFDFASFVQRKNPAAVIHAFIAAFPTGQERVQLLIKTQNAKLYPREWTELLELSRDPRILMRDVCLSRVELCGLMKVADAFVSLHRSEGFGRGPAEAMLLGIPVILTNYSGTSEFAHQNSACMVGFSLVPVRPGDYPDCDGQHWAEADIHEAACHMRWIHEKPAEAWAMGLSGQQYVKSLLSPQRIGTEMLAMLDRASATP